MKLQPASKKEVKRIAIGTAVCDVLMIAVLFLLSLVGIGKFELIPVLLGTAGGTAVAVLNFTIMCLTIQNAVNIDEKKQMKAFIQGSYNGRLLLQALWIVVAFVVSHINVIAAAIPLLFPNLTIYFLQSRGKLVTSSGRSASSGDTQDEPEDHLGSFEV